MSVNVKRLEEWIENNDMDELPTGWRVAYTNEGKMYYQNEITRETQWNKPIEQNIPTTIVYTNDNKQQSPQTQTKTVEMQQQSEPKNELEPKVNEIDESDKFIAKWYHRRNIIFCMSFIMNFVDIYSDLNAGIQFIGTDLFKKCETRFQCEKSDKALAVIAGIVFIIAGTLSFCIALIATYKKAKKLLQIHKYCKTKQALKLIEVEIYKTSLTWDILPLIIEDIPATILNFFIGKTLANEDQNLKIAVQFSVISSLFAMIFKFCVSWRYRCTYSSFLGLYHKICHGICWCGCFCVIIVLGMGVFFMIVIANDDSDNQPLVSLNTDRSEICQSAGEGSMYFDNGQIVISPHYIFANCSGEEYVYNIECNAIRHMDNSGFLSDKYIEDDLQCKLSFNYTGGTEECESSFCEFAIHIATCEYIPVICTDFSFFDGNATMFVCFDYCSS